MSRWWNIVDLRTLRQLYERGCHVTVIADLLARTPGAVRKRVKRSRMRRVIRGPYLMVKRRPAEKRRT